MGLARSADRRSNRSLHICNVHAIRDANSDFERRSVRVSDAVYFDFVVYRDALVDGFVERPAVAL